MLISTTLETSTNAGPQRIMCLYCPKHWSAGTQIYCRIVYYEGRVYGDKSYERGNLVLRVA